MVIVMPISDEAVEKTRGLLIELNAARNPTLNRAPSFDIELIKVLLAVKVNLVGTDDIDTPATTLAAAFPDPGENTGYVVNVEPSPSVRSRLLAVRSLYVVPLPGHELESPGSQNASTAAPSASKDEYMLCGEDAAAARAVVPIARPVPFTDLPAGRLLLGRAISNRFLRQ